MSEKYSIGIDFGTLSGRALLVRISDGKCIADAVMDYPHAVIDTVLPASGEKLPADYALQDPHDYLEVLSFIVRKVMADSGVDKEDVISMGVDFTCCTVLPVTKDMTPLCFEEKWAKNKHAYVKLWKHHAAEPYAVRLNEKALERGEEWMADYGNKTSGEWIFPKIWEILDNEPEIYYAADGFMEAGDFITSYLIGKRIKSFAFSTAKALYSHERGYPSREFFASLDPRLENVVEEKLNAEMIDAAQSAGRVCSRAAKELGLSENTVVGCPNPDAHVATVGLKMNRSGDMCAIMGTSSCYMMICDERYTVNGICGVQKNSMTPGFYGYEAGLCCVGDHFAWAAEHITPAYRKEEAKKAGLPLIKYLVSLAAKKRPGETGLIALDWWNGNRNILVDSSLSGMILGMSLTTRAEDILRALIEATAFATRVILENYKDHGIEIKRFIAAGGIARKDPFTMQLYADVLGIDIAVASSSQTPALSSAIYAAAAAGLDLNECMENMGSDIECVYHPNSEDAKIYDVLYAEYLKLHDYFGRGENNVMKRLRQFR